jgi:ankyrin repeat protein
LYMACEFAHADAVTALMESAPHQQALHMADVAGIDALAAAARGGNVAIVKALIESGSPLGTPAQDGALATHQAVWCGHMEVLKYLLDNHADDFPIEATNSHGDTVLQVCLCPHFTLIRTHSHTPFS